MTRYTYGRHVSNVRRYGLEMARVSAFSLGHNIGQKETRAPHRKADLAKFSTFATPGPSRVGGDCPHPALWRTPHPCPCPQVWYTWTPACQGPNALMSDQRLRPS